MSSWRPALRIAWRDALRHKGRTALVVAMVGLPVLGLATADVLVRTVQLSPGETAARQLGTADASLEVVGGSPTAADIRRLLGPGTAVTATSSGAVSFAEFDGLSSAGAEEIDLGSPLTRGLFHLRSGRIPVQPDEVVLTTSLAHDLHLSAGDSWAITGPARTVVVVGTVVDPGDLGSEMVLAEPDSLLHAGVGVAAREAGSAGAVAGPAIEPTYLVSTPVAQSQIAARVGHDFAVTTRESIEHPPPTDVPAEIRSQRVLVAVVAVGLGVLQVILLAGAAFAVGARRQLRDLALVAAAGGEAADVRRIVLAGGLVAGAFGGFGGIALGIPLAAALEPVAQHVSGTLPGSFDLRPAELATGLAIGLVAGLLAAWLPARTAARQDVVLALVGRRGVRGTPRALTLGGLAAIVVGGFVTLRGAEPPASASLVLGGSIVGQLGFVACAPALVGLAARGARWLPLSGRMALRDAARHRARSGPAVAAVMAALAGAIAISTYSVSSAGYDRSTYLGETRLGQVTVNSADPSESLSAGALRAVAAQLPTQLTAPDTIVYRPCDAATSAGGPGSPQWESCPDASIGAEQQTVAGAGAVAGGEQVSLTVGGDELLEAELGRVDPAAEQALAQGDVVVLDPRDPAGGDAQVVSSYGSGRLLATLRAVHPSIGLARMPSGLAGAVISPATAQRLGLAVHVQSYLIGTTRVPTRAEQARAQAALAAHGGGDLSVERGYQGTTSLVQVALVLVAGLVTLLAVGIATGLAAAEGRADLATLAAVGASPGVRRRLAMAEAASIGVLGAVLGVFAGLLPALAVVHARSGWPIVLPWSTIGLGLAVVPAIAALLAGAVTRSRLPLIARAA